MSNFSQAEEALRVMEDSAGSADSEMEKIQNSLEYRINAFKETWVGMAQELVNREDFGKLIDSLTKGSEGFGKAIQTLSPILSLFADVVGVAAKAIGDLADVFGGLTPFLAGGGIAAAKNWGRSMSHIDLKKCFEFALSA